MVRWRTSLIEMGMMVTYRFKNCATDWPCSGDDRLGVKLHAQHGQRVYTPMISPSSLSATEVRLAASRSITRVIAHHGVRAQDPGETILPVVRDG